MLSLSLLCHKNLKALYYSWAYIEITQQTINSRSFAVLHNTISNSTVVSICNKSNIPFMVGISLALNSLYSASSLYLFLTLNEIHDWIKNENKIRHSFLNFWRLWKLDSEPISNFPFIELIDRIGRVLISNKVCRADASDTTTYQNSKNYQKLVERIASYV